MQGTFLSFSDAEIRKAIMGPTRKKAASPHGFPVELFRELPSLLGPVHDLRNGIITSGHFPVPLLRLYLIILDKPNRGAGFCKNKRPIFLLRVPAEILEMAAYHRFLPLFKDELEHRQYEYGRSRRTELHQLELWGFVREARASGQFVSIAVVEVGSAFDAVSHGRLMQTLDSWGMGTYRARYVHTRLTSRFFQVHLDTPGGRFLSGLPQGGVLSPPFAAFSF